MVQWSLQVLCRRQRPGPGETISDGASALLNASALLRYTATTPLVLANVVARLLRICSRTLAMLFTQVYVFHHTAEACHQLAGGLA